MRKDFTIDEVQLYEARVNGADAILLIAAALTDDKLFEDLHACALSLGLTALVGSHMVAMGGGSIINISSIGAQNPSPASAPYSGSKAALNTITRAFAREYGPNVRVNAIMPGAFRTDIAKAWDPASEASTPAAAGRYGEPAEIRTAVLYLASDHSGFTTGSVITVDGGRY